MWRNYRLIYPVTLFLLLAISATLGVGYAINFALLEDVLRERMVRQAEQVGHGVQQAMEQKIQRLERFRSSWLANVRWSQEARADSRLLEDAQEESPQSRWQQVVDFFPFWGVDFILLLDGGGQVSQRIPADMPVERPVQAEILNRVHAQIAQNPASWHLGQVAGEWQVMFLVPVAPDKAGEAHNTLLFGLALSKVVNALLHENAQAPFLLADGQGALLGARSALPVQASLAATVIQSKAPYLAFDSDLPINFYYTPIPLLDQTLALVIPVALDEVRQALSNSRERLVASFGLLIVILLGLGLFMEHLLLRPLRRLRQKAAIMVSVCSREEQALYLNPQEQGNEIVLLERAMEEASIKIYAHVAHLVDSKCLLEGYALKDPVTALGNRRMLDEFLGMTLGTCRRKQRRVAVLLLVPEMAVQKSDQDNQLLRELANRLCRQMRSEDLAFRIEHNEFVSFVPECGDEEQVLALVFRLHRTLSKPYELANGVVLTIKMHIGIAIFPEAGDSEEALLGNARVALDRARQGNGPPFALFNHLEETQEDGSGSAQ
ncbi:MAG: GGDEF domain-containing protein [Magnetococcales bacterium]|nr:GGDEF domain-containing protein [Magnetococcales bacterium]MBF0116629.1 GGDEF domain-containing protein [Magnetococcales bacterium]